MKLKIITSNGNHDFSISLKNLIKKFKKNEKRNSTGPESKNKD